jgi:hypothetical protein
MAAVLLLGAAGSAGAQSLYGPGGLFLHPTASMPARGQLTPAVLVLPQHHPVADQTRTWVSVSAAYGATDDLEVGATYLKVANWDREGSGGGFARYRFLRETSSRPAAAVGFTYLGFGDVNARTAFMAFQKQVNLPTSGSGKEDEAEEPRHPVILHLGALYIQELDGFSHHQWEPYGGVEVGVAPRLRFIAEGRPRGNAEFGTPLALTLAYQYGASGRLALTWANNGLSDDPRFGFGAGFAVGGR